MEKEKNTQKIRKNLFLLKNKLHLKKNLIKEKNLLVERLVQDDIRMQTELEAKKQKEQMPKKIGDRIQWARERSKEHNAKIKKNKAKYRGMEL